MKHVFLAIVVMVSFSYNHDCYGMLQGLIKFFNRYNFNHYNQTIAQSKLDEILPSGKPVKIERDLFKHIVVHIALSKKKELLTPLLAPKTLAFYGPSYEKECGRFYKEEYGGRLSQLIAQLRWNGTERNWMLKGHRLLFVKRYPVLVNGKEVELIIDPYYTHDRQRESYKRCGYKTYVTPFTYVTCTNDFKNDEQHHAKVCDEFDELIKKAPTT